MHCLSSASPTRKESLLPAGSSVRAFLVEKNQYKTRECPISPQRHSSLELSAVKVKLESSSENSRAWVVSSYEEAGNSTIATT